jgi:hypothetical protein
MIIAGTKFFLMLREMVISRDVRGFFAGISLVVAGFPFGYGEALW